MIQNATRRGTQRTKDFSDRKQRIHWFLKQNAAGVLSTVDPDGNPHGVVIYYVVDDEFVISFLTRAGTKKYDNLKHHNHVMFTVFDAKSQTTVQVTGRAEEITNNYDINGVAGKVLGASLKTNKIGLMPINKLEVGPYVAFTIQPVQIRMAVYARPDPGDYTNMVESIESFDLHD